MTLLSRVYGIVHFTLLFSKSILIGSVCILHGFPFTVCRLWTKNVTGYQNCNRVINMTRAAILYLNTVQFPAKLWTDLLYSKLWSWQLRQYIYINIIYANWMSVFCYYLTKRRQRELPFIDLIVLKFHSLDLVGLL